MGTLTGIADEGLVPTRYKQSVRSPRLKEWDEMRQKLLHTLTALVVLRAVTVPKSEAHPEAPGKPSFLLIATEDMDCRGTTEVHSPNLDQLAAEGLPPGIFLLAPQTSSCSQSLLIPNLTERLSCIRDIL